MIKVINETSSRDSIELKFDSIDDMFDYIDNNKDVIYDEWDDNDSDIYLRVVDDNGVVTTVSASIDKFSPKTDIEATITIGKDTYGPKYFDSYPDIIEWSRELLYEGE